MPYRERASLPASERYGIKNELIKTISGFQLGCALVSDAGGREFETPTGPTLRVFK